MSQDGALSRRSSRTVYRSDTDTLLPGTGLDAHPHKNHKAWIISPGLPFIRLILDKTFIPNRW